MSGLPPSRVIVSASSAVRERSRRYLMEHLAPFHGRGSGPLARGFAGGGDRANHLLAVGGCERGDDLLRERILDLEGLAVSGDLPPGDQQARLGLGHGAIVES